MAKPALDTRPRLSRGARISLIAGAGLLVLLAIAPLLDVYVDWLWFGELGFRRV